MDTFLINKDALLWPEGVGEVDKSWEDFREGVRSWEFFLNILPSVNERPLLNCVDALLNSIQFFIDMAV